MANATPKMMPSRIALIDADTILYAVASASEICARGQGDDGEDLWFQVDSLSTCYKKASARIEHLLDAVEADTGIIALSDRPQFRYDLLPSYKSNRKATRRPPMLAELQDLFQRPSQGSGLRTLLIKGLEADDVVGISSGQLQAAGKEPVIVSEDKDLKTIPGLLYQKGVLTRITRPAADRFHMYQTLVGDPTDGYKGCPGIGDVKATFILDFCEEKTYAERWSVICGHFIRNDLTPEDALVQARVARILRVEDWDPVKKEPILWEPPYH